MGKDPAKQVRKDAKRLSELTDEVKRLDRLLTEIDQEYRSKHTRLEAARTYASIGEYDKATKTTYTVSVDPYGHRWWYQTWDNSRQADIYINAHNSTTYGVNVNKLRSDSWQHAFVGGKNLGFNYTLEEAQKLAVDWITGVTDTDERW